MKGEVKVLPYPLLNFEIITQISRFYRRLAPNEFGLLEPEGIRQAPGEGFLIKFKGIDDRNAAESLHDEELFVNIEDLPPKEEDEFYVFELVGLKVVLPDGKELGEVVGLMPVGPYELLEIKVAPRKTIYLPMIEDIISEIDLEKGVIHVTLTPDLLESQGVEV
ncbi:hypothetical protein TH606_08890 [Thermodesulfatator autotrophicus]|uniref:Ribosome maturation factor RimM n=2 Tax=Thermodesulfatator autotrophicus TaxID=1795632 RepID=A0A177E6D0_9BACT|nr:hypothetical protein TH606_08890 [Thermodesulfatator autotrophicus]